MIWVFDDSAGAAHARRAARRRRRAGGAGGGRVRHALASGGMGARARDRLAGPARPAGRRPARRAGGARRRRRSGGSSPCATRSAGSTRRACARSCTAAAGRCPGSAASTTRPFARRQLFPGGPTALLWLAYSEEDGRVSPASVTFESATEETIRASSMEHAPWLSEIGRDILGAPPPAAHERS